VPSNVEAGLLLLLVRCLGFERGWRSDNGFERWRDRVRAESEGGRVMTATSGGGLGLG
jgi:hypothetical protein